MIVRKDLVTKHCVVCNNSVLRRRSFNHAISFCGTHCQSKYKSTGRMLKCSTCYKECYKALSQIKKSKSGNYFCSRSCSVSFNNTLYKSYKNNPNYTNGLGSYRIRALKKYGLKCSNLLCKIESSNINISKAMLDVDHIDNNRLNNDINNLRVLCVWCHAEKTRVNWYK